MMTRSAPTAPVYICLDAGFQETKLDKEPEWPDVKRFQPPKPPRPSKEALDQAVAILLERQEAADPVRPRLAQGRVLAAAHPSRRAARRLRVHRPQAGRDVPERPSAPLHRAVQRDRQGSARADVRGRRHPRARLDGSRRRAASGQERRHGHGEDHRLLARPEPAYRRQHGVPGAAAGRRVRGDDRRRDGRRAQRGARRRPKDPWKAKLPAKKQAGERRAHHGGDRPDAARPVQRSGERDVLHARPRLADRHLAVPERHVLSRQGRRRRPRFGPRHLGRLRARAASQVPGSLRDLDAGRRRLLHGRDRDLERGEAPHSAARHRQQQPLLLQRRAASGPRRAGPRPRAEEPLDRPAHGRSGAEHRQARRSAGRGRHRAGHHARQMPRRRSPRASTCSRRAASA